MDQGNYDQSCQFFEYTLGKFRLKRHIRSTTPSEDHDGIWRTVDSSIINWILATISKGIFDIVRGDRHDDFTLWHAIEGLF